MSSKWMWVRRRGRGRGVRSNWQPAEVCHDGHVYLVGTDVDYDVSEYELGPELKEPRWKYMTSCGCGLINQESDTPFVPGTKCAECDEQEVLRP